MVKLTQSWASDSGHWYTQSGDPAYTYTNSKGEVKNTTLREARKLGLVPSVTTVTKVLASPGLQVWGQQQVLLAALTLPRRDGESDESFIERVMEDSKEQTKSAALKGEEGHAALERAIKGESYDPYWKEAVEASMAALSDRFPGVKWESEKSFASQLGFGGRVDLHGDGIVVDFKSKESVADAKPFDEHFMQGAAYVKGLFGGKGTSANLFFSRNPPWEVKLVVHSEEDMMRGWEMFECCLKLWVIKNKYQPNF